MNSIRAWLDMVAPDPLFIVLGLFTIGTVASHFLFKNHPIGRAIVRVVFLFLLTVALLDAKITPFEALQTTGLPLVDFVHAVFKIAWWLWAAWFVVAMLRATLRFERQPHEGRLLQDVVSA